MRTGVMSERLKFEVSETQVRPSITLFYCSLLIQMPNSVTLQHHVCLHATTVLTMTVSKTSESVSQPQLNDFLYKICHCHCISLW